KPTVKSVDGYIYKLLSLLQPGVTYHFKVSAYDKYFNESDCSNTLSSNGIQYNYYDCVGDIASKVQLDFNNLMYGTVPLDSDYQRYLDGIYDVGEYHATAILESGIIKGNRTIYWYADGDPRDILFEYCTSDDG